MLKENSPDPIRPHTVEYRSSSSKKSANIPDANAAFIAIDSLGIFSSFIDWRLSGKENWWMGVTFDSKGWYASNLEMM